MRAFLISNQKAPVALVFHEHKEGVSYCRTKSEAFLRAFELARGGLTCRMVMEENKVRVVDYNEFEYDWVDSIVESLDLNYYKIEEIDSVPNNEQKIDELVEQYL